MEVCCAVFLPHRTLAKRPSIPALQAHEEGKCIKGKPQAAVFAAIIFLACRQTGNPRSFKEITKVVVNAEKKASGRLGSVVGAGVGRRGACRRGTAAAAACRAAPHVLPPPV